MQCKDDPKCIWFIDCREALKETQFEEVDPNLYFEESYLKLEKGENVKNILTFDNLPFSIPNFDDLIYYCEIKLEYYALNKKNDKQNKLN